MPELPEVETVVRSLRPLLVGRRILDIDLPSSVANCARNGIANGKRNGKIKGARKEKTSPSLRRLLATPVDEFRRGLRGVRVESVRRHGKNVLISVRNDGQTDRHACLLVHLGMTGRLVFESTPEPTQAHTHLIFNLDAPGSWLHFSDPRRFGKLRLITNPETDSIAELGPDPLEISAEEFYSRLHDRRTRVKSLLLDQRFLRGLGNIYADESLFRAGIHPAAIAARINRQKAMALFEAIRETLTQAIELGGSSISSYVDAQGRQGWFQQVHQVYQKTGEPCFRCGAPIRRMIIAGRSTHFCPSCQSRSGHAARQNSPVRKRSRAETVTQNSARSRVRRGAR